MIASERKISQADEVRLFELDGYRHRAKSEYEISKESTASKKKAWELTEERFDSFLEEVNAGPTLPFGDDDEGVVDVEFKPLELEGPKNQTEEDTSWKAVTLESLGVPKGTLEALATEDIVTMGDLTAWNHKSYKYGKDLTSIGGIGRARADEVGEIAANFWASWRPVAKPDEPNGKPKKSRMPKTRDMSGPKADGGGDGTPV